MFSKLSLFVAIVAPLASALTLQTPTGATSGGQVTLAWTSDSGDPNTWSFELLNTAFHNAFAIANNVDPSTQVLTLSLPIVPVGDGYTLQAVNIGNITDVYATSGDFAIGAASSSSSSGASTASTATTPVVTPLTSTTTGQLSTVIVQSSSTLNANPSTTGASTPTQTAAFSGASRRLDFNIGSTAAVVFAIGGAAILAL